MKATYKEFTNLFGTYAFGTVVREGLSILLVPLYTRFLTTADYGVLALLSITSSLMTRIAITPIRVGFTRYYYSPEYEGKGNLLLWNMFLLLLAIVGFIAAANWMLSPALCAHMIKDMQYLDVARMYSLVILLTPIATFLTSFINLKKMARFYVGVSWTMLVVWCGVSIVLMAVFKLKLMAAVIGSVCGIAIEVLAGLYVLLRHAEFRFRPGLVWVPIRYALPQIADGYSNLLIKSGDRYVLQFYATLETVGLYSFGYRIASLISLVFTGPSKDAVTPIVLERENREKEARKFIMHSTTYYYTVGMVGVLALSFFAREVIMLFAQSASFYEASVVVPTIAYSYLLHGLGNFFGWGLIMAKKSFHISFNVIVAAVVNIALNFAFIPIWGFMGAAYATLVCYFFWNAMKAYYSWKFYRLAFEYKRMIHVTVLAALLYALAVTASLNLALLPAVLAKLFLLVLYPVLLLATRFPSAEEAHYLRKIWNLIRSQGLGGAWRAYHAIK